LRILGHECSGLAQRALKRDRSRMNQEVPVLR
jgi:hypothetical protein